jgi:predicted aminopeptidase
MPRFVLILVLSLLLSGCYYMQAAKGQLELNRKREPIEEVLQDEDTSPELATRLRLVQEARQFSVDELGLPDNKSYRTYAAIERDFVIWNVIAAPEFSTQPKTWCFPVAGCVGYRGYFSQEDAQRESEKLAAKSFDVVVGGVVAYSTLGKFSDPVISTMMSWDDVQLVGVLFHELAHQVLYVKGDTAFNEAFATAVEEFGVLQWLESRGQVDDIAAYSQSRQLRQDLMSLVAAAREDLEGVYAGSLDDEDKRHQKESRLHSLGEDAAALLQSNGRNATKWVNGDLNNASLVSMTLYEGRLPEFRALLVQCEQRIECFYDESRALAGR